MFLACTTLALAADLPPVDTRLTTGVKNPADAALVIGNAAYPVLGKPVPFAAEDASAFYNFLVYTRGVPPDRVRLLRDPTPEQVTSAAAELAAMVEEGGRLWVYYAGDGGMDPTTSDRLLLMHDVSADPASYRSRAVAVDDLRRLAGGEPVFVIDACFNGSARGGGVVVADGKRWVTANYAASAQPRGVEWAATQPQEAAGAWYTAGHGRFTYFALGALRGWADGELDDLRDGTVTAREADAYVSRMLKTAQVTDQRPLLRGTAANLALSGGRGARLEARPDEAVFAPTSARREDAPVAALDGEYAALLEAKRRREAAEAEEQALQARVEATRRANLDQKRAALLRQATAEWALVKDLGHGPEAKAYAEKFVAKYTAAAVEDTGLREVVVVPELAAARAYLGKVTAVAGVQAPTAKLVDEGLPGFGDEVVEIAGGTFTMGSPASEAGRGDDETQHSVTVARFAMGRTEVSQKLYAQYQKGRFGTAYEGVSLIGDALPAQNMDWCDAVGFANWMTERWNTTKGAKFTVAYSGVAECESTKGASVKRVPGATGWRLPTEAEWEYAARAGTNQVYAGTSEVGEVCRYGNVDDQAAKHFGSGWGTFPCTDGNDGPARVGSYLPNAWALYDMTGNVREWTGDWYWHFPSAGGGDPGSLDSVEYRSYRGGSWADFPGIARIADRGGCIFETSRSILGLRLARSLP